jgi:hypothetical protein
VVETAFRAEQLFDRGIEIESAGMNFTPDGMIDLLCSSVRDFMSQPD